MHGMGLQSQSTRKQSSAVENRLHGLTGLRFCRTRSKKALQAVHCSSLAQQRAMLKLLILGLEH